MDHLVETPADLNGNSPKVDTTDAAQSASASTTTDKKRGAKNVRGNGNGNKRRKEKVNHSFDHDGSKERHPGSFAVQAQRDLFHISMPPSTSDTATDAPPETSKKKVALALGYLGTKYGGFQINQGVRSIQAELEWALYKCGFINEANFGYPSKYSWSTSGRTDKGVHAAAQTISFKMELSAEQLAAMSDETDKRRLILDPLNAQLPADVHVWDVNRTTRNFCAKTQRDRVRYEYLIPSYILSPQVVTLLRDAALTVRSDDSAVPRLSESQIRRIQEQVASYRATPEQLQTLSQVLNQYVGTHSFHNFTRRCSASEMRAKRYIMDFAVDHPVLVPVPGNAATETVYEWIPTSVTGQSFLFNQIRKMISLAVDVTRGVTPMEHVAAALDITVSVAQQHSVTHTAKMAPVPTDLDSNSIPRRRKVAIAPAQGLFLDMSYYTSYNRRKNEQTATEAVAPPDLEWSSADTAAHERWKAFRDGVIVPHVVEEEANQGNFLQYLYQRDYVFSDEQPEGEDNNEEDDDPIDESA